MYYCVILPAVDDDLLDAAAPHPDLYKCFTPNTNPTNVTLNFTVEAFSNGKPALADGGLNVTE